MCVRACVRYLPASSDYCIPRLHKLSLFGAGAQRIRQLRGRERERRRERGRDGELERESYESECGVVYETFCLSPDACNAIEERVHTPFIYDLETRGKSARQIFSSLLVLVLRCFFFEAVLCMFCYTFSWRQTNERHLLRCKRLL